eukprot:snap_masked-scaffold_4-processed-gene-3.31-mRNA-1 protein AED:1.00 eAED:1.00 QI:0/-1/0/0/-1/1/1/0/71
MVKHYRLKTQGAARGFIVTIDLHTLSSVMKRKKQNTLANIPVAGTPFNYLTFTDDIVTVFEVEENIFNFVN